MPTGEIQEILDASRDRVNHAARRLFPHKDVPSAQALKNLYGAWFEKTLTIVTWNAAHDFNVRNPRKRRVIVPLPDSQTLKFWHLFDEDAQDKLEQGLFAGMSACGISMTMSNPDFICVSLDDEAMYNAHFSREVPSVSAARLQALENTYNNLKNRCSYKSFVFGLSVKTELRPDRRYQIIYEGSIFKALLSHLVMRYWDKDIKMKYYGLSLVPPTAGDARVMTNPSIDSLISVWVEPRRAVDEMVSCSTIAEVKRVLRRWLD